GLVVYSGEGKFKDGRLDFVSNPPPTASQEFGIVTIAAMLSDDGTIRGEWVSTTGPGGTLHLWPHDPPSGRNSPKNANIPEQIHTATHGLEAVRLYDQDVAELAAQVRRDFAAGRLIITHTLDTRGATDISQYAEDFLSTLPSLKRLSYLKLFIQEPDAHG